MRTAVTIGLKHDGKTEVLIAGRLVPINEQKSDFQELLGVQVHKDYSEVSYSESEDGAGHVRTLRFISPEVAAAQVKAAADEKAKIEAEVKAKADAEVKAKKDAKDKADAEFKAAQKKHDDAAAVAALKKK